MSQIGDFVIIRRDRRHPHSPKGIGRVVDLLPGMINLIKFSSVEEEVLISSRDLRSVTTLELLAAQVDAP